MMRRVGFVLVLVWVLAACGGEGGAVGEAETAVTDQAESPPTVVENVTVPAEDGLLLQASLYRPAEGQQLPGVLLLHMLGSSRQAWQESGLPDKLAAQGYAVLALDMRGHGETGGERNWMLAEQDVGVVWAYFTGLEWVDAEKTAVIGASIGANLALRFAASQPKVQAVVLLSPGLDYRGVTTLDALARYGSRPLFIAASEEDGYAAESSMALAEQAGENGQLQMLAGAGHGTNMLTAEPELETAVMTWLNNHLQSNMQSSTPTP
ncbi:MAG: alpha/beta fold hydrolase [Chloroflexi bacterium]|nr:MAG: alpha/beta fold hydrolase [Chloroflexota bacterium]